MRRFSFLSVFFTLSLLLAGCGSTPSQKDYPVTVPRFLIEADSEEVGINARLPISGSVVRVSPKSMVTEYDVTNVQVVQSDLGAALMFQLTPDATRDLYRISATNQGKRIVTTLNGEALAASRMDRPLAEGVIVAYLEVPATELPELAKNITRTCVDLQKELAKKKK